MIELRALGIEDLTTLQDLLEKCSDYLLFQDGEPVSSTAAEELFASMPPDIDPMNKDMMGIYDDTNNLIGIFELIQHFRDHGTLTLALMMIDPAFRGSGVGKEAHRQLEVWAVERDMRKIRIGVLFGNESGLKFWEAIDYVKTGEIKDYKTHKFMVMEKNLKYK